MRRLISPGRLAVLGIIIAALLALYITTLYRLQIVEGAEYYEQSTNSIVSTETVVAARGNILDRYGRLLVSNRNCNNLLINTTTLFEEDDPNAMILKMCSIVTENGDTYTDDLPITTTAPFEYVENMTSLQSTRLQAWLSANGLDSDATAVEVMAKMRTRYDIDSNYTAEEMRIIAGIRYSINVRYLINTSDYVYAEDVSIDTITALMEADVTGFEVQVSYVREYNTEYAAHILGYTGLMTEEEYETYSELGYKLNATVGKSGVEKAFEELLHGTDGTATVTRTSEGIVTSTVYTEEPEPGNHVYLTIDIELQAVAESALASYIEETNAEREAENAAAEQAGKDDDIQDFITGGAVVAIDVNTGEPLCIVSYPTYSLSTLMEDYSDLLADSSSPLFNRALSGTYAPGSTFKPLVALAGLASGGISVGTEFTCTGIYDKYADQGYSPSCTGSHGALTVSKALTYSCNVFFFSVGDTIGISAIDEYAALMGLGETTGIELDEASGAVASPDYKAQVYAGTTEASWYAGDTLQTSIGQSVTGVTPIQMARYAAALANSGTGYNCSILKSVSSYDYSESIYEREPSVYSTVDVDDTIWNAIQEGMYGVANEYGGTAYSAFHDFTPTVAAKTGTTQSGTSVNDAFFICYAPYDDPEIAVVVAVENGAYGANLTTIAKEVLEYYFDFEQSTQQIEDELTLLS
ncbi:MAG: penicillin-binding protein [Oscillospiraceae bacterium]|nr:penicillin-binding protein [Oscillospiraceae bacterium]